MKTGVSFRKTPVFFFLENRQSNLKVLSVKENDMSFKNKNKNKNLPAVGRQKITYYKANSFVFFH